MDQCVNHSWPRNDLVEAASRTGPPRPPRHDAPSGPRSDNSSETKKVIERLYACSHLLNDAGQYAYCGRVGGCLITGNEDGVKHCAMADAGWIGDIGPGPSYLDPGSGGPENDFTNRNVTFMTWSLMHLARMLKNAGGIPVYGNQRSAWDHGERFDFMNPNPEYR